MLSLTVYFLVGFIISVLLSLYPRNKLSLGFFLLFVVGWLPLYLAAIVMTALYEKT
ncbi:hypothetical protein [Bacillus taeanensis]|uniref:hypothetical protein n=1 Tax=Bacillus taeanensis TaxID=273032 RepID=UPI0015F11105|nr:hypothetical protein [Bacillus taeanensis]